MHSKWIGLVSLQTLFHLTRLASCAGPKKRLVLPEFWGLPCSSDASCTFAINFSWHALALDLVVSLDGCPQSWL